MEVSIIIPVFNEEESLDQLIGEIDAVLAEHKRAVEVVFVNDCSTDNSAQVMDAIQAKHDYVRVVHRETRGGQTGCYQLGFNKARGEYIIRLDADLQDNPRDLVKFFACIDEGTDLVMGLRQKRMHKKMLKVASMLFDVLVVIILDSPFHANASSFICFRAKYVQGIKFRKNDHRYLNLIAIQRGATRTNEVIVQNRDRKFGTSKYQPYKKILLGIPEVIRFMIRLKMGYYNVDNPKSKL